MHCWHAIDRRHRRPNRCASNVHHSTPVFFIQCLVANISHQPASARHAKVSFRHAGAPKKFVIDPHGVFSKAA
jgi:hypothetical protein